MKPVYLCALVWLAALFCPLSVAAADTALYTIVDGDARVLRGIAWSKLVPGARAQEGDLVELAERAQIQVEMARGGAINVVGPASVYAASLPGDGKAAGPAEWALSRGWAKAAATPPGLRLRMALATVEAADAIVLVHGDAASARIFVESGAPKVGVPAARGKDAPARDAHAGELWTRSGEKPFTVESHMPPGFVATIPRPLLDALPRLAPRFAGPAPTLTAGAEVTYADAESWLSGPYRRAFVRRLTPRLSDPEFRAGVEARIGSYPEWDRMLHPEKYATDKAPAAK